MINPPGGAIIDNNNNNVNVGFNVKIAFTFLFIYGLSQYFWDCDKSQPQNMIFVLEKLVFEEKNEIYDFMLNANVPVELRTQFVELQNKYVGSPDKDKLMNTLLKYTDRYTDNRETCGRFHDITVILHRLEIVLNYISYTYGCNPINNGSMLRVSLHNTQSKYFCELNNNRHKWFTITQITNSEYDTFGHKHMYDKIILIDRKVFAVNYQ
jgi:hypothetical protein